MDVFFEVCAALYHAAKNICDYMEKHIKEKHPEKFKEIQNNWQQESRNKRRGNRTLAQELEYKESESARIAELRKRKTVEAAEAKLAEGVRDPSCRTHQGI